ncbi:MAG: XdhC family protein [Chthoniobacterales bacterium]|nr:XdhC family protein [Chthoniobacterales bacterium]
MISNEAIYHLLLDAAQAGEACALVTVAKVIGSAPRENGAKMVIYEDGRSMGTIGGGKFESLVIADAVVAVSDGTSVLKTYPLHEGSENSFGAICGGEVTLLIEPQPRPPLFCLVGAGHCSQALAKLARGCGFAVLVLDDRIELLGSSHFPSSIRCVSDSAPETLIREHRWSERDALVLVGRNYHIDREALAAALESTGLGYIGMIGSRKKVRTVFDELAARGFSRRALAEIRAPIGINIGADSPGEIAVSVLAEVFMVLRRTDGRPLRELLSRNPVKPEATVFERAHAL